MSKHIRICILAVGLLLASGVLFAQSSSQAEPPAATLSAQPAGAVQPPAVNKANAAPHEDEEENIEFKYSAIVRKVAGATGLSKEAVYWIFMIINFAILASALGWVVRKVLPNGFAPRTAEIQKSIEEARKASADASTRLAEIEGRLAKLDTEIAAIRTAAEADFSRRRAAHQGRCRAGCQECHRCRRAGDCRSLPRCATRAQVFCRRPCS